MPESKQNFIKAKMNQDLDDRLVPSGEYRVGQNVTISRSEGDDVGTFQNILGNSQLTDFNLTDENLEVIGYTTDDVNNNVYIFITNYTDSSSNQLINFAPPSALNAILVFNLKTENINILVSGNFLNFSKTHPVLGVNLIENLLFWTDNRNQPRKININSALNNINYYDTEDKISVAKYYPYQPIEFYSEETRTLASNVVNSTQLFIDKIDDEIIGDQVTFESDFFNTTGICVVGVTPNPPQGSPFITVNQPVSLTAGEEIKFTAFGLKNCSTKYMATEYVSEIVTIVDAATGEYEIKGYSGQPPANGSLEGLYVSTANDTTWSENMDLTIVSQIGLNIIVENDTTGSPAPTLSVEDKIKIYRKNPNYDSSFSGDSEFLKDKFIRFSYRFKYDDDEYSLMAPFTQAAFIPENFGSFVDDNESVAAKSSILKFWENLVDCVNLNIKSPTGSTWAGAISALNISEVQIVCKFSDEISIKVIDNLDIPAIQKFSTKTTGFPGNSNVLKYRYLSQKPIRTLPEKEISRVSDQVPIRALSQESAGNRIIYGNFYDKHTSPEFLNFKVGTSTKVDNTENRSLYNHSLKQNRTYQIGLVLSDRYGRQSDVILSSVQDSVVIGDKLYGGATTFNPYADDNKFSADDIINWFGDQIILYVDGVIPESIIKKGYPGLYTAENPLGWYSYKVVVKQQEQDYYNVYMPNAYLIDETADQGDLDNQYYNTVDSYFSLVNDNINKIPKDLDQTGTSDMEYRASERVFPRVQPINQIGNNDYTTSKFVETSPKANLIDSIFQNAVYGIDSTSPGDFATVEIPIEDLYKGKTALTAKMQNQSLKPFGTLYSNDTKRKESFSTLGVLETKPTFSNLDIFYESSSAGLVSELNEQVQTGNPGAASITPSTFTLFEDIYVYESGQNPPVSVTGDIVKVIEFKSQVGAVILDPTATCTLSYAWSSVTGNNVNIASKFTIVPQLDNAFQPNGRFLLYANEVFYYGNGQTLNFTLDVDAFNFQSQLSFSGEVSNRPPKMGQGLPYDYNLASFNNAPYSAGCVSRYYNQGLQTRGHISDFNIFENMNIFTTSTSGIATNGDAYSIPPTDMGLICYGGHNQWNGNSGIGADPLYIASTDIASNPAGAITTPFPGGVSGGGAFFAPKADVKTYLFLNKLNGPGASPPGERYLFWNKIIADNGSDVLYPFNSDYIMCPCNYSDMIPLSIGLGVVKATPNNGEQALNYSPYNTLLFSYQFNLSRALRSNGNYTLPNTIFAGAAEERGIGTTQSLLLPTEDFISYINMGNNGDLGWTNGTTIYNNIKDDLNVSINNVELQMAVFSAMNNLVGNSPGYDQFIANCPGQVPNGINSLADVFKPDPQSQNFLDIVKDQFVTPYVSDWLNIVNNQIVFNGDVFWSYYGGIDCGSTEHECQKLDSNAPKATIVPLLGWNKNGDLSNSKYCEDNIREQCDSAGTAINPAFTDSFNSPDLGWNISSQTMGVNIMFDIVLTDASSSGNGATQIYKGAIQVIP